MSALANDLEAGFEILWYKIESVLGRGGFGITYLATDTNLGQLVAIKEYLPHDFASRSGDSTVQPVSQEQEDMYSWGLERFMSEAQTLAKFKHHNIVRVLSVFKHNNTGYMVMEYEQGRPLNDIYKEKKTLTQSELEAIYLPIIDGLSQVHKVGFIHRDIKPANIYIRDEDGSPVLLDFGAARQAVGGKTRTLTSMLSIGYAPFEQYNDGSGKQGPWTDIYALGACLHQGITGQKPTESTLRGMALLHDEPDPFEPLSLQNIKGYSPEFLRAIDQGLMLQIHDRPQTLEEFTSMLKGEIRLPDLPPREDKKPAPINNDRTVIRQVKGAFHDNSIQDTDNVATERITITEAMEAGQIPSDKVADNVDVKLEPGKQPAPKAEAKTGFFTSKMKLLTGGIALLVLVISSVIIFSPDEKSPEQVKQEQIRQAQIKQEKDSKVQIKTLLGKADDYYDDGTLVGKGKDNALSLYKQVLTLDADNKDARNGLQKISRKLLSSAENSIDNKDYTRAEASLTIVASIDPDFPGLKTLQKQLSSQVKSESKFEQLEILLGKAQNALNEGQIYSPEANSAYSYFKQALTIDPENINATLGLSEVADTILLDARKALGNNKYTEAKKLADLVESISPNKPALADIKQLMATSSRLQDFIARADKAYSNQQYTSPASNNALDLYNQVLSISPGNAHAISRIGKMADFYAGKARSQIRSGRLSTAQNNINTLRQHFPDYAGTARLQADLNKKQDQIDAAKADPLKGIRHLIPTGINQKQGDDLVVQDIVGQFIQNFKTRNIKNLKRVAQLNAQQEGLYTSLFKLYQSMNLKMIPSTFTVNKSKGVASVKFQITDLIDKNGNNVQTSANWTQVNLSIRKKSGVWLKAEINKS